MAKGLPKWAIKEAKARGAKNIFAYAWTLVKRKGRKSSRKSNLKKTKRRGGLKMAKKKKRYSRKMTIPLAPVIGLVTGLATPPRGYPKSAIQELMDGNINGAVTALSNVYLGYNPPDGSFDPQRMSRGLLPLVLGVLVHKFVGGSPLNFNRFLARHKIPLIRI